MKWTNDRNWNGITLINRTGKRYLKGRGSWTYVFCNATTATRKTFSGTPSEAQRKAKRFAKTHGYTFARCHTV